MEVHNPGRKASQEFDFGELFPSESRSRSNTVEDDHSHDLAQDMASIRLNASGEYEGPIKLSESKVDLKSFKLLHLVGQGGFGKVYQAMKEDTGEIFALKALKKDFLISNNSVECTRTERDILRTVRHPFIVALHFAFQCEKRVYLVMDFINGGQILYHLREQAMFSEKLVKFYAAEVVLALEHLHSLDIVHRDLKPENVLLDSSGHISLTDFGFAKESVNEENKAKTFCGTMTYMSPEMIKGEPHGKATDWWSLGILIFDMLTGNPPWTNKNENKLSKKILTEKIPKLPSYYGADCQGIVNRLLDRDVSKRLGSTNGAAEVKSHKFFAGTNWNKLLHKEIDPPFRPKIAKGTMDIGNFDEEYVLQGIADSPVGFKLSTSQEQLFQGFSYARTPVDMHTQINTE
eukprot:TRINITY_DN8401_c0_g1_i1.p1 TRINITY_DN8401_c0_g1~~TRINITY_DN8401_c0_g1_i1.p1  ORF type:complete len:439 (-),score=67.10 TRINITY_DN8401_c0_g1_i1:61-1272(-)